MAGAALGSNIAGNSVENNWLSDPEWAAFQKAKEDCVSAGRQSASCGTEAKFRALSEQRDEDRASYISAARAGLIANNIAVTPAAMAAIDARYWQSYGIGYYDAHFLGTSLGPTQLGPIQHFTDALLANADAVDGFIPGAGLNARLVAGTVTSLGQTWGAWFGVNPATGLEVVGTERFDARFLTVVDIATAGIAGGTSTARTVGKTLINEVTEQVGQRLERTLAKDAVPDGMLPSHMLPDNVIGDGIIGHPSAGAFDTAKMANWIEDFRSTLSSDPKRSGNMAVADVQIEGMPSTLFAHSSISTPTAAQEARGLVGRTGDDVFKTFEVPNKAGEATPRSNDSEAKILTHLAQQLGGNTSVKGNVRIFTERVACDSCMSVVDQFKAKYPGIKVDVVDNNNVMLRPRNPKVP